MKRFFQIMAVAIAVLAVAGAGLLIPRLRNMSSEYGTAQAIRDVKEHLQSHGGKWPVSPADLGGKFPVNGSVHVDYSVTSARLIESPALLRDSIRPRSGRFHTFPHCDEMIRDLHEVLKETNQRETAPSGGEKPSH